MVLKNGTTDGALYADPVAKVIFDKHQIMTKIDFEKTPGGRDLYEKLEHNESAPAYTYYDLRGQWAANSNSYRKRPRTKSICTFKS